ncbi:MAG TPA: TetR/AcrR family transcriptional regulator [Acidimicrobiia bacterium]|jgi:AcrR family transcriptional regulator|nr:TetR/AcrR family transcriptional regulator [Acidimicrobiia bacterium]
MVSTRNTRADVVATAGRMFAEKGYHGTSMRDLGKELGLLGSSLYSHIDSKENLLVEVVDEGARLFLDSAHRAMKVEGSAGKRLTALIAGHVDVVLDHQDVVRTYLNEARMLDEGHRSRVVESRDAYEMMFRSVIGEGVDAGEFRADVDPKIAAIFVLSILNALERWYRPGGELNRDQIVEAISQSALASLG